MEWPKLTKLANKCDAGKKKDREEPAFKLGQVRQQDIDRKKIHIKTSQIPYLYWRFATKSKTFVYYIVLAIDVPKKSGKCQALQRKMPSIEKDLSSWMIGV